MGKAIIKKILFVLQLFVFVLVAAAGGPASKYKMARMTTSLQIFVQYKFR